MFLLLCWTYISTLSTLYLSTLYLSTLPTLSTLNYSIYSIYLYSQNLEFPNIVMIDDLCNSKNTKKKSEQKWLAKLLYKPANSKFIELDTLELYKYWNGRVILDSKWDNFGFKYYLGIWIFYIAFLLCFAIATSTSPGQLSDENIRSLLITTIILGLIHLNFEVRQFIWNPMKYVSDFWNYFGMILLLLIIISSQ